MSFGLLLTKVSRYAHSHVSFSVFHPEVEEINREES